MNVPVGVVINAGALPTLLNLLDTLLHPYPIMLRETLWIMVNLLAAADEFQLRMIKSEEFCERLASMMTIMNSDVLENALWCLSNLVFDDKELALDLLNQGVLKDVPKMLHKYPDNFKLLSHLSWTIYALAFNTEYEVSESTSPILSTIVMLIQNHSEYLESRILLSTLAEYAGSKKGVEALIETDLAKVLIEKMNYSEDIDRSDMISCIKGVTRGVSYNSEIDNYFIENNLIEKIKFFYKKFDLNGNSKIELGVVQILSNLLASSQDHFNAVVNSFIRNKIVERLMMAQNEEVFFLFKF